MAKLKRPLWRRRAEQFHLPPSGLKEPDHGDDIKGAEPELRLRVRPGTKQALTELMEWAAIEEQGEALTLMIHRLHELGPERSLPMREVPRHEIEISQNVAREFRNKSLLAIQKDPGDEIIGPTI